MRRFVRDHSLSLFFLVIFLASLAGLAIAGHALHNDDAVAHHSSTMSFWRYLRSSDFGNAVMENWQSEYLQFMLFMLATIWLVERGSPESKQPGQEGLESDQKQKVGGHAQEDSPEWAKPRGIRTFVYSNSLLIVMSIIFFGSWFAQSVTGWTDVQRRPGRPPPGDRLLARLPRVRGLLGGDAGELAVRVPRGRLLRGDHGLPAPARLLAVEAGRNPPRRHRRRELRRAGSAASRPCRHAA